MRRAGKYRSRRRGRRGFGLFVSFICIVMIFAATASAAVIFFKIGEIKVTGETVYTKEEIIEASNIHVGQSMFLFNKFASISNIFAVCPYIDEIQMRRSLPDTIEIIVTPCVPAVAVHSSGAYYLMDVKGKILQKIGNLKDEKIPVVTGGQLSDPEVGKYAEFLDEESAKALFSVLNTAKNNDILDNIGDIDITRVYEISFKYQNRFLVKVGGPDDMEHKFRFLQAVIDSLGENEMGIIDISDGKTGYFTLDRSII